ncbi:MAG: hypothetical protein PVI75_01820 [Gammaproteobacteria bacterium]|jgi:hypothetical protein
MFIVDEKQKKEWRGIQCVLTSPIALSYLILMLFAVFLANLFNDIRVIHLMCVAACSISAGFFGSKWQEIVKQSESDETILSRGQMAIRRLNNLLSNLKTTIDTIEKFLEFQIENSDKNALKIWLESLVRQVIMIQKEGVSAIEDWGDLMPDYNVKKHVDLIGELRSDVLKIKKEKEEIEKNKVIESEEKENKIKYLTKELEIKTAELQEEQQKFNASLFGGLDFGTIDKKSYSELLLDLKQ